jgi:hypothetical protein
VAKARLALDIRSNRCPNPAPSVPLDPQRSTGNVFALSINALRMASGWLVFRVTAFACFTCGVSSFGLTPHFVPLCGDFGINPMTSTSLLTVIGVFDLFGTIGSGWLSDWFDNRWLLAGYLGFRGLSLLASYLPRFFAAGVLCIIAALSLWLLQRRAGPAATAHRPA